MKFDLKRDWKFWTVLIVAIIVVLAIAFFKIGISNVTYIVRNNSITDTTKYNQEYELTHTGEEIGQIFLSQYNNLSKIDIQFSRLKIDGAYLATNGAGTLGLKDMNGNIIYEKKLKSIDLVSNSYYEFKFPTIKESANKNYYLYFRCDELVEGNEFYKVCYSNENINEDGAMYINGEEQPGDIFFQEMYYNAKQFTVLSMYIIIIVAILSLIAIIIYYDKKIDVKKLFWYIIPTVFVLFLILMPSFKNHDEPFHWFRIYDIAQGNYLTQVIDGKPMTIVEEAVVDITNIEPKHIKYNYIIETIKENVHTGNDAGVLLETTAIYNPIQYLPQTTGGLIVSLLGNNLMLMTYGARIINMVISIFLLYFAIKLMPFGKRGMLVSMCFPIAIEGFTSMSPDALTISVAYLFTAYVFNIVFNKEKQIRKTDIFILAILSIVIALCKIVYLPLVGLLLLIPKAKFKTQKSHILTKVIIMGLAISANLIWLKISANYLALYKDGNSGEQLWILLQNPIYYLQRLFATINHSGGFYAYSLLGQELGWNEFAKMDTLLPTMFGLLFMYINIADNTIKQKLTKYQNIILSLIILAIIGLVFTSLYIQWNEPADYIIKGVQGRYFIPVIPILTVFIFSKLKFKSEQTEEQLNKTTGIAISILFMYVFTNLFILNM